MIEDSISKVENGNVQNNLKEEKRVQHIMMVSTFKDEKEAISYIQENLAEEKATRCNFHDSGWSMGI